MHADDYLLLDRYLQDELSAEEAATLRDRLRREPALAAALAERQEWQQFLRARAQRPALEKKMAGLAGDYFAEQGGARVVPLWRRPLIVGLGLAAAVALVLLVWNPFASGDLYQRFADHPPLALAEKSTATNTAAEAEAAFTAGNYETAYAALTELLRTEPTNLTARLALGISALETDRLDEAQAIFSELADGTSTLRDYGIWYLALSQVKAGDAAAARATLERLGNDDPALRRRADELLQSL
jgi:cytochrome c-type biogenesis protein CcmH/NrfG